MRQLPLSVPSETMQNAQRLFLLDVLVFLDDVVCLIDAEFSCFGEVGDGMGGVVEKEVENATVEVGFGKMVVLLDDMGEAFDGIVDIACLGLLEGLLEGVEKVVPSCCFVELDGVFVG